VQDISGVTTNPDILTGLEYGDKKLADWNVAQKIRRHPVLDYLSGCQSNVVLRMPPYFSSLASLTCIRLFVWMSVNCGVEDEECCLKNKAASCIRLFVGVSVNCGVEDAALFLASAPTANFSS